MQCGNWNDDGEGLSDHAAVEQDNSWAWLHEGPAHSAVHVCGAWGANKFQVNDLAV